MVCGIALPAVAGAQICPPPPGRELPRILQDAVASDPTAFQFQRAWIRRAREVREFRQRLEQEGMAVPSSATLAGTIRIPVIAGRYSSGRVGWDPQDLHQVLFGGLQDLTDYYREVSGGLLTLTGAVIGTGGEHPSQQENELIPVSQRDTYYEGNPGCHGLRATCGARTGHYLKELLDVADPLVDFGRYDSDGPDGVPNSGDDDGYVDICAFVHPEQGGECGGGIWSHHGTYAAWWGGAPYVTNDPAASGGRIRVDDYTIQPLASCNGASIIEIGIYAHEFGHGFDLPDLYDTDGSSEGVGHWCLMGTGNWGGDGAHPQYPTHMCAWAKDRLGWVQVTVVQQNLSGHVLLPVQTSRQVLKVYPDGVVGPEYFLIEHRARIAFDWTLPAGGVAIWHVDDDVPGNDNENHKRVDLEEADGLNHLDLGVNRGDAGDLYPGASGNTVFDHTSNPSSLAYFGMPSYLSVTNISAGDKPSFDLAVGYFLDVTSGPLAGAGFGQGASWVDYDMDGDSDLFVTGFFDDDDGAAPATHFSTGPPPRQWNKLLRNTGGGNFLDVTSGPLGGGGRTRGAAWGDYDGDGDPDLYLANHNQANRLLRNDGASFTDVTSGPLGDAGPGRAVSWVDYDLDRDLDLYLVKGDGVPNRLFRNDGNGVFVDAATGAIGGAGFWVAAAWADYDNDGDPDVLIASEIGANRLLRNDGRGAFTDVTTPVLQVSGGTEAVAWGDYDNDGDLDLYLANRGAQAPDRLLRNDAGGVFTDVTSPPLGDAQDSYGAAWADYDNDGDLDLYLSNGASQLYRGYNRLYRNKGGGRFRDDTRGRLGESGQGRGIAWGDYDSDGRQDLYRVDHASANRLFRNVSATGGHWLEIDLVGVASNVSAIGARVTAVAGGRSQIREVSGGGSHGSQDALTVHFGLGSATVVDSLIIRWPHAAPIVQTLVQVPADRRIRSVQDVTAVPPTEGPVGPLQLLPASPNPFRVLATVRFRLAGPGHVRLRVLDPVGRRIATLANRPFAAGEHAVAWPGIDDTGRPVPNGVYFISAQSDGAAAVQRVALVR